MSQRSVEIVLGRMLCNEAFRREFFRHPEKASERHGLPMTTIEIACLSRVPESLLSTLAARMDPRIREAPTPDPPRQPPGPPRTPSRRRRRRPGGP